MDVLKTLDTQIAKLVAERAKAEEALKELGQAVEDLQKKFLKLGSESDETKTKLEEASSNVRKAAEVAAAAVASVKDLGGRVTSVDERIQHAIKPVAEKVDLTAQKLNGAQGEATRALKRIVEVEEARVAKDCAQNVIIFDCGALDRGRDSEINYAKKVAKQVGAAIDIKAAKSFQTKRKLGNGQVKQVTNLVVTVGSQAQASSLVFNAAKEHKKTKGASNTAGGGGEGGAEGSRAAATPASKPIPNIQLDLTLPMRERLRQAKRQKGEMIEAGRYQPNLVWYRVVDGIPRLYTRAGEGGGQVREWHWDQQGKCYVHEQQQAPSQQQGAMPGTSQ